MWVTPLSRETIGERGSPRDQRQSLDDFRRLFEEGSSRMNWIVQKSKDRLRPLALRTALKGDPRLPVTAPKIIREKSTFRGVNV